MKRSNVRVITGLTALAKPLLAVSLLAVLLGTLGYLCATFLTVLGAYKVLELMGMSVPVTGGVTIALIVLCPILRAVSRYLEQMANHYMAFRMLAIIRDKVFRALRRLSPAKLEGRGRGDFITLMTTDVELLEVYYAHTISPVLIALLYGVILLTFVSSYHVAYGVLLATCFVLIGIVSPVLSYRRTAAHGVQQRSESAQMSAFLLDRVRGLDSTMQFDTGAETAGELREKTEALGKLNLRVSQKSASATAFSNTMVWGAVLGALALGMVLLGRGSVSFDGMLIPVVTIAGAFGPALALSALAANLTQTLASGRRVLDILEEEPLVREVQGGATPAFEGEQAQQISFGYHKDRRVLHELSLTLPKNRVIGIVGESGSGKSTLLKLLMRFWDVDEGKISFGKYAITQVDTAHLHSMQGLVDQDGILLSATIAQNIKIGKPDATHEELVAACEKAHIHSFIMQLPEGYDAQIGELGERLSSGERQRLCLARALLYNAPMLLMDEPTSNLDSLSEAVILKSVAEAREGKTVFVISHRQSTVSVADEIYRMEDGALYEEVSA